MKLFKIFILIGSLGFSIFYTNLSVYAEMDLGGFKCSTFATQGNRLAIFIITDDGRTSEEVSYGVDGSPYYEVHPLGGNFFCVEVGDTDTTASWKQMIEGRDANGNLVIKREWGKKDVTEEWLRKCAGFGTWTDDKGDQKPQDVKYELTPFAESECLTGINPHSTQRYDFNGLGQTPNEYYVYFIKIATTNEQQPNPIPVCSQKNGTTKETCESVTFNDSKPCFWRQGSAKCSAKADTNIKCSDLTAGTTGECSSALHCKLGDNNTCVERNVQISQSQAISQYITSTHGMPDGYTGPLPACAFTGECRSVEDLVQLGVNVANWLFGIIAGLGFAFFVYGGITMILSFGNSEKVSQGKQMLVAATIGMVIAFSAYILVGFIVKAIGINPNLVPF